MRNEKNMIFSLLKNKLNFFIRTLYINTQSLYDMISLQKNYWLEIIFLALSFNFYLKYFLLSLELDVMIQ